jgi:Na+-driven multidrug efflux pump
MNVMLFWLQVMQDWLNSANKTLTNYQHRVLMNVMLFWLQVMQDWLNSANKTLTNFQHRVLMNAIAVCSSPLFCKISFTEVQNKNKGVQFSYLHFADRMPC